MNKFNATSKLNKKMTAPGSNSPKWILLLIVIIILSATYLFSQYRSPLDKPPPRQSPPDSRPQIYDFSQATQIAKFKSAEEYEKYLASSQALLDAGMGLGYNLDSPMMDARVRSLGQGSVPSEMMAAPDRISTTNVQVAGIDEPDIIKTDGQEIYYGGGPSYYPMVLNRTEVGVPGLPEDTMVSKIIPPDYNESKTKLIKAWPAEDLKIDSIIDKGGNLLLADNTLLVFASSQNSIYAYDVSDKTKTADKWHIKLENNTSIVASRLYKDKLYLVTSSNINQYDPCPFRPLSLNDQPITIDCKDIYHPTLIVPVDTNLSVLRLNTQNGEVEVQSTFVASSWSAIVYMSEKYLYLTYNHQADTFAMLLDFLQTQAQDLLPAELLANLKKVSGYDLSQASKMTEFQTIIQKWQIGLNNDDRLKVENELQNRLQKYGDEHKRDLVKTEIISIRVSDLKIKASGLVPGTPLNQFSLDENDGYLRIATNIGGWFSLGFGGSPAESANDVYVLDSNLKIIGSVKDLGVTERIYSARFIGPMAYLVTFRQTDPFYVLDLSDPKKPRLKGELKIPGYSSYLHPLSTNRILGIGQESGQLKLSLFDVSNPSNPQEIDKYTLNEYGSESLYDHHAFLQDDKHQVFFIPGYNGAYVFSYAEDKLTLARALDLIQPKRALYLNDYLYVLGSQSLFVLKESDWSKVNQLDLSENK